MAAEESVVFDHFAALAAALPGVADAICRKTAFDLVAYIQTHMSSGSPSSPGDPPGVVTGTYKNSWQADQEAPLTWAAYTPIEYGPYLEYGTVHMAPRPHAVPAADAIQPEFTAAFQALERYLASGGNLPSNSGGSRGGGVVSGTERAARTLESRALGLARAGQHEAAQTLRHHAAQLRGEA